MELTKLEEEEKDLIQRKQLAEEEEAELREMLDFLRVEHYDEDKLRQVSYTHYILCWQHYLSLSMIRKQLLL
jgi:hypothetical protein